MRIVVCSSGVGKDRDLRTAIRPILRGLNTLPDCTSQCAQQSHKCSHRQCSIPGTWCSAACGFIESITEMCRILREEGLGSSMCALQSYPFSFSRSWAKSQILRQELVFLFTMSFLRLMEDHHVVLQLQQEEVEVVFLSPMHRWSSHPCGSCAWSCRPVD